MFENNKIKDIRSKLEALYKDGSLAGTWLFCGTKGLGKASFAISMAKFILSGGKYDNERVNSMVDNKAHPDLLYIQRDYTETEKKDIIKILKDGKNDIAEENRKRNAEITVDDVRKIDAFVHLSSSTDWKIIIIDSCDDLNKNAANAVLKSIEEPPSKCAVFLISHNPARLLPTILSRCKKIKFSDFSENDIKQALSDKGLTESALEYIAATADGSIGKALSLVENDAYELFSDFLEMFENYPKTDRLKAYDLASKGEKSEEQLTIIQDIFLDFLLKSAKIKSADINDCQTNKEKLAAEAVAKSCDIEKLLQIYKKSINLFNQTKNMYLDKKQVLVNCLLEV
jgi:DNA polymerase-3 subunit delta'